MVWVLRFSDEPSLDSYLEVIEKEAEKAFSICQDLVMFLVEAKFGRLSLYPLQLQSDKSRVVLV